MGRVGSAARHFPQSHNPSHAGGVPGPSYRPGRSRLRRPDRPQSQRTTWRAVPLPLRHDALSRPPHGRAGLVGIAALDRLRIRSLGYDDCRGPTPSTGTRSARDRPASPDARGVPDRAIRSRPGRVPRVFSEQCATRCGWESVSWRALQRAHARRAPCRDKPRGAVDAGSSCPVVVRTSMESVATPARRISRPHHTGDRLVPHSWRRRSRSTLCRAGCASCSPPCSSRQDLQSRTPTGCAIR